MIGWLQLNPPVEPSTGLIAALAEMGAYYNGRGWFRVCGPDEPVRVLLGEMAMMFEPGVPPEDVLRIEKTGLPVAALALERL